VLIDERPGVWCASCGLVALPERRHDPLATREARPRWDHRLRRFVGAVNPDARAAAAVAVVLGLVVAALHLHGT
jgi:hypothetical protein